VPGLPATKQDIFIRRYAINHGEYMCDELVRSWEWPSAGPNIFAGDNNLFRKKNRRVRGRFFVVHCVNISSAGYEDRREPKENSIAT
jgi:hypothetical protein